MFLVLLMRSRYQMNSKNELSESRIRFTFDPGIDVQRTGISKIEKLCRYARSRISASCANPFTLEEENSILATGLLYALNPHWVSEILCLVSNCRTKENPMVTNLLALVVP